MGGPGSTRWGDYEPKRLVEETPSLDVASLVKAADRQSGWTHHGIGGRLEWSSANRPTATTSLLFWLSREQGGVRELTSGASVQCFVAVSRGCSFHGSRDDAVSPLFKEEFG